MVVNCNCKGFSSINVQVVCDADLKIMDIVTRWCGSVYDSQIFRKSRLKQRFDASAFSGNNIFNGDEEERLVKSISGKRRRISTPSIDKYKPFIKNGYTRQYPDNSSNGDFVVYVEHLDREITLCNMNPLNLSSTMHEFI
ncbi:unnamed protein product [Euphydryas editha]|uniref:DDE Tnp4 domain-containing protein n=1 Tax=Euphydryas editha TaxID=104508 RepID=A0AAU9UMF1_EUPED|nr:unnamed protein product [Euphydryas editha]